MVETDVIAVDGVAPETAILSLRPRTPEPRRYIRANALVRGEHAWAEVTH